MLASLVGFTTEAAPHGGVSCAAAYGGHGGITEAGMGKKMRLTAAVSKAAEFRATFLTICDITSIA